MQFFKFSDNIFGIFEHIRQLMRRRVNSYIMIKSDYSNNFYNFVFFVTIYFLKSHLLLNNPPKFFAHV